MPLERKGKDGHWFPCKRPYYPDNELKTPLTWVLPGTLRLGPPPLGWFSAEREEEAPASSPAVGTVSPQVAEGAEAGVRPAAHRPGGAVGGVGKGTV